MVLKHCLCSYSWVTPYTTLTHASQQQATADTIVGKHFLCVALLDSDTFSF